jgi:ERCC4-type nuclease|tara:strand:+ start:8418 stop:9206 length:789 start_codon:yes stop_codon:yes gene_type:complete
MEDDTKKIISISVDSKEKPRTKQLCEMLLNAEIENLDTGDIKLWDSENPSDCALFERKTWADAYGSWQSRRMQEQVSRLVTSAPRTYLIIEGTSKDIFTANSSQVRSLQQFLNRMSSEVLPVVYTDSLDETIRFIRSHALRMSEGEVHQLIRPVTVVTSTSNKHHALLEQIPRVGKNLAKKIYGEYGCVADFMVNFPTTSESVGVKPNSVTYKKICLFLEEVWNTKVDREIIWQAKSTPSGLDTLPVQGLEDIISEQQTKLF